MDRQTASTSAIAPYSASGTPEATCAFQIRAPSRWMRVLDESAHARSSRSSSTGTTAPPAKLWVFSTDTAAVGTKNGPMSGAKSCSITGSGRCPSGWIQVRIVTPLIAPWAPSSARAMWALASHSTSWPGATTLRTASTLAIEPVGVNSAAS